VQAYAMETSLRAFKGLDPSILQMLAVQTTDPRLMVSLAMKELAQNAAKIGNLNISPELMQLLMEEKEPQQPKAK
jgi:hypothetical protein